MRTFQAASVVKAEKQARHECPLWEDAEAGGPRVRDFHPRPLSNGGCEGLWQRSQALGTPAGTPQGSFWILTGEGQQRQTRSTSEGH